MRTAHPTLTHRIRVSDDTRYLAIGQVRERFGVSAMRVWHHIPELRALNDFFEPPMIATTTNWPAILSI
jgi:hypothetical protein